MISMRDYQTEPLQVLSFGGGTQSTAMLHLIHDGKLPKPDIVVFADTGSELPETIEHVFQVAKPFVEQVLQVPFHVVGRGAPLHVEYRESGYVPMAGIGSCTAKFKIRPQRHLIREIVGNGRGKLLAECWLGITTDEVRRRTESDVKWCGIRYPLLDDYPMSRDDCIQLNDSKGWEVVKSGCFVCPHQGRNTWMKLRETHPDLFAIALDLENHVRAEMDERGRPLRVGLLRDQWLSELDDLPDRWNEDSTCDSGGGCFI